QILSGAPHIDDSEDRVKVVTDLPLSEPRDWVPTDAQLAAMFDAIEDGREDHEGALRYMIMALNTWARPEAITELSVKAQVKFDPGNPPPQPAGAAPEQDAPAAHPPHRKPEGLAALLERRQADPVLRAPRNQRRQPHAQEARHQGRHRS